MTAIRICISIVLIHLTTLSTAQNIPNNEDQIFYRGSNSKALNVGDSIYLFVFQCKNAAILRFHKLVYEDNTSMKVRPEQKTVPFMTIHGNILYSFNYQSYIDTPFAQQDLQQHFVQTNFDFLIKNKYPLRLSISHSSNNSDHFSNSTDISFQYNRRQLLENIKNDLRMQIVPAFNVKKPLAEYEKLIPEYKMAVNKVHDLSALKLLDISRLKAFEKEIQNKRSELAVMESWFSSAARLQEVVEEKEKRSKVRFVNASPGDHQLLGRIAVPSNITEFAEKNARHFREKMKPGDLFIEPGNKIDSLFANNGAKEIVENASEKVVAMKKGLEKIKDSLNRAEKKLAHLKASILDSVNTIRRKINVITNPTQLYSVMRENGLHKNRLTKAQRLLLSINQVGIGRNWIDYSELTVKNISLTGFNIEANPSNYYFAFAAGKVNYRFRDFIYRNKQDFTPKQSVALARIGLGHKDNNNFILTFYDGVKAVLNTTATTAYNSTQHILGISAESRIALDANNYIVGEFARSSYYSSTAQQASFSDLKHKLFNLKEKSNQAYSLKLNASYPQINTKLTAYYKRMGEHFQSFTLYPSSTIQEAWLAKINQAFWKKRITIDAAIRKNDFVSPIAAPSFDNKNIFKSLQLSIRVPKYPFVSVGYFPSSQLSLSSGNILTESQYNTLSAVVSHSYIAKRKLSMNTNLVYTKFYNSGSDTGFLYYNAASWSISQSVFLACLMLQSSLSITDQQQMHLVTLEQNMGWNFKKTISLNGGLKWTRENHSKNLLGANVGININVKNLGTIQMRYDKTYLPGSERILVPVDIGQVTFYREF